MSIVRLKNRYGLAGRIRKAAGVVLKTAALALPVILMLILVSGFFGVRYLCVVSPSMEPELPVGSLIVVVPADPAEIQPGDNVAYTVGANTVTHKAVANDTAARTLTTRGINGKLDDAPVAYSAVLGTERVCIPGLGTVVSRLMTVRGKIILLTVTVSAVLALLLWDFVAGRRKKASAPELELTA